MHRHMASGRQGAEQVWLQMPYQCMSSSQGKLIALFCCWGSRDIIFAHISVADRSIAQFELPGRLLDVSSLWLLSSSFTRFYCRMTACLPAQH
jgi:hypothetical protein